MPAGGRLDPPDEHRERGVYVASGAIAAGGSAIPSQRLAVFAAGDDIAITAEQDSRLILLGSAPLDGPRIVWWNFVASRRDLIEKAKERRRGDGFGSIEGDPERLSLPD